MENSNNETSASRSIYYVEHGEDYQSASVYVDYVGDKPKHLTIYTTTHWSWPNDMWRSPDNSIHTATYVSEKETEKLAAMLGATSAEDLAEKFANIFIPQGVSCNFYKWLDSHNIKYTSGNH